MWSLRLRSPAQTSCNQLSQRRLAYFNQPRRRKYHMGTTALAAMSASA
jgi:hypothetical protein